MLFLKLLGVLVESVSLLLGLMLVVMVMVAVVVVLTVVMNVFGGHGLRTFAGSAVVFVLYPGLRCCPLLLSIYCTLLLPFSVLVFRSSCSLLLTPRSLVVEVTPTREAQVGCGGRLRVCLRSAQGYPPGPNRPGCGGRVSVVRHT